MSSNESITNYGSINGEMAASGSTNSENETYVSKGSDTSGNIQQESEIQVSEDSQSQSTHNTPKETPSELSSGCAVSTNGKHDEDDSTSKEDTSRACVNSADDDQESNSEGEASSHQEKAVFTVYKRRWYILALFSLMALTQSWAWNTWGPIASSAKFAFRWNTADISILTAWGPVMFVLTVLGFSWLIETKGLRWACLITQFSTMLGMGLRCITTSPPLVTWMMNLGQLFISVAGPVSMAAAAVISATWFPPNQRTTATALANRIMAFGGGFSFLTGPFLVRDVSNSTNGGNSSDEIEAIRGDIRNLMYIEFGWSGLLMLLMLLYFPARPPTPPCLAAAVQRVSFRGGLKAIVRNKAFWMLGLPYATAYGIYVGWIGTLDVNLQPVGISEKQAGWLGFVGSMSGVIVGICMGRVVDLMAGRTKPLLIALYVTASAACFGFAIICAQLVPMSTAMLYVTRVVGAACLSAMVPLVFETLCEATYPIPESVTNGCLTLLKNFWCFVFLLILMFPQTGTAWMNWLVAGSAAVCVPFVVAFKESHRRLEMDVPAAHTTVRPPGGPASPSPGLPDIDDSRLDASRQRHLRSRVSALEEEASVYGDERQPLIN